MSGPLCHRCERRARVLEGGQPTRFECGQTGKAVACCYAYAPVRPLTVRPIRGDTRAPFAGMMTGARVQKAARQHVLAVTAHKSSTGTTAYWAPG